LFCNSSFGNKVGGYADFDWFRVTKFWYLVSVIYNSIF
jgi:hypothetical protein